MKTLGRGQKMGNCHCTGKCLEYDTSKKLGHSIYDKCAKCYNCDSYIPRNMLIFDSCSIKARCPCCNKCWIKAVYFRKDIKCPICIV